MIAKDFRRAAWESLHGRWGTAVLVGLIASILGGYVANSENGGININLSTESVYAIRHSFPWESGTIESVLSVLIPAFAGLAIVGIVRAIVMLVIGGAVSLGYAQFNLDVINGREAKIETLFACFSHLGTGIAMRLLIGLFTFLWSLLFVIPGIIASYRYAMTPYILAEHPEMGVMDAIGASKEMMKGNKFRLFCLQFSFIGWRILTALTFGILSLVVHPYIEAAQAAFYREISGTTSFGGAASADTTANTESDGWSYGSSWETEC